MQFESLNSRGDRWRGTFAIAGKPADDLPLGTLLGIVKQSGLKKELEFTIMIEKAKTNHATSVPDLPSCVSTGLTHKTTP
ncbi:MAG: hypothetical protein OXF20_04360 [Gammaproteobacteria bacterium]|nr:hypothetical protein [Gammaproteobacteria bacterium]